MRADEAPGRPVLDGYSTAWVNSTLAAVAAVTLLAYGAYTFVGGAAGMPLTIPFVAFGIGRYLRLVNAHGRGEQPDRVLLEDRPLQLAIVLWVVLAGLLVVRDG